MMFCHAVFTPHRQVITGQGEIVLLVEVEDLKTDINLQAHWGVSTHGRQKP